MFFVLQGLLNLKDEIDFYHVNCFARDKMSSQIIMSVFEYILNLKDSRVTEYISLFIDDKLKKNVRGVSFSDS